MEPETGQAMIQSKRLPIIQRNHDRLFCLTPRFSFKAHGKIFRGELLKHRKSTGRQAEHMGKSKTGWIM